MVCCARGVHVRDLQLVHSPGGGCNLFRLAAGQEWWTRAQDNSSINHSICLQEVSTFETFRRFTDMAGAATSPWLLLKTLPGLGPRTRLSEHPR